MPLLAKRFLGSSSRFGILNNRIDLTLQEVGPFGHVLRNGR